MSQCFWIIVRINIKLLKKAKEKEICSLVVLYFSLNFTAMMVVCGAFCIFAKFLLFGGYFPVDTGDAAVCGVRIKG